MKTSNDWKATRLATEKQAKELAPQVQATKKTLDETQANLQAMIEQHRALNSESKIARIFETNFKNVEDKIKAATQIKAPVLKKDKTLKNLGRSLVIAGAALVAISVAPIVSAAVTVLSTAAIAISGVFIGATTMVAGTLSWIKGRKTRTPSEAVVFKETTAGSGKGKDKTKAKTQTMLSSARDMHIFETARSLTKEANAKFASFQPKIAAAIQTRIQECVAETGAKSISLDQALALSTLKK